MRRPLLLLDLFGELAKILRLFVACLYLELCELARSLIDEDRDQSFKLSCRFASLVSLFKHQVFKFPDCLVVIHLSLILC